MEYFARNDSKIVLAKSICEVVATSTVSVVLFERARGGGLTTLVWRSGLDSASPIARRCQVARIKAGSREPGAARSMHSAVPPALARPRSTRGPVAGNNSEDSCTHAGGGKGQLGHSGRLKVETDSDPPAVLSTSMCRTTHVAMGCHLQVVWLVYCRPLAAT
jgi:hypothetical protein